MLACGGDTNDRPLVDDDGATLVRVLYAGASELIFSPGWDDTPKFLIFEPLVTYEANSCSDIVGGLSRRWEPSDDFRTWTVELRPDVLWHDGVPVTSEDVAFTVGLWKHPEVLDYNAGPVDSIVVLDSLRFRVHLGRPGDWPVGGWEVIYPAHLLEDLDPAEYYDWDFWRQPVGNGPFRYVRHVPETMVELEANPDYYLGRPRLDRVRLQFKTGGQGQVGLLELMAGNVDVLGGLSPIEAQTLADRTDLDTYYVYQAGTQWLIWNYADPLLDDLRVRRALAHATNREELQRLLGYPEGAPVTDGVFPLCEPQDIRTPAAYEYDPERARALLAEVGWHDTDNDGWVDRDGQPFELTLKLHSAVETQGVFVQDQLRRVGVRLNLQMLDGSVLRSHFQAGDYQSAIVPVLRPEWRTVRGETELDPLDPALTEALTAAIDEPDLERRMQLWALAGERYREHTPAMFLNASMTVLAADRRIRGFGEPGTVVRRMSWRHAFGGLGHLWVED
jgi:peptide/nickel transport system substrate-binding protein